MKPAPERLVLDSYPFAFTITTRLSDVDSQQHLNNAAIAYIYEDARARMHFRRFGSRRLPPGSRLVVANLSINYLGEGFFPDDVVVGCGIVKMGGTSHTVGQGLFQHGVCIGAADIVLVHCHAAGPAPMPDDLRMDLQPLLMRR